MNSSSSSVFSTTPSNVPILSTTELSVIAVTVLFLIAVRVGQSSATRKHLPLPPGPSGVPFFGNLFQVPVLRPYPKFRQWAQQYGSIFHLRLGPQHVVVLNTAEAADELFVNRSKNYSSRAPPHVAHDIMSAGQRMVFLPYGKEWKTARKTLMGAIGPTPSKRIRPLQELESRVIIYDLMMHGDRSLGEDLIAGPNGEVPEDHWFSIIRRYTTSIVMSTMYGKRVSRIHNNPYLHKIYDVLANFTHVGQPGNYLADAFPILRKLPDFLAPWRVEGRKMHIWEMELWGGLLEDIKKDLQAGIAPLASSFVPAYIQQRAERLPAHSLSSPGLGLTEGGDLTDVLLAYTAGTVLEAGSDTTASTMQTFVLMMLSHPAVYRKAREEIDRVVGPDRLPGFEDETKLPYLVACIKETLRRRPPTIMGIPHAADEDDNYEGHLIPKGATIIGNVWAIHMDPKRYPNPTAWDPERFYKPNEDTEDKTVRWGGGPDADRDHYVFGWGRRFCQGSYIAEASLFIVLARLLWALDIQAPVGPNGSPDIPDLADEEGTFTSGFVSTPKLFRVAFKAREGRESVVRRGFEDAQMEWAGLGLVADER